MSAFWWDDPESQSPYQKQRDLDHAPDPVWGLRHRHFASSTIYRDGDPNHDCVGTPRRVYVFDAEYLDQHERAVAQAAVAEYQRAEEVAW